MTIQKNDKLLPPARSLRKDMTPHERKLWYLFLKSYPVKIYNQRIIDNYIVDFYCASAKLIIEIDGSQHFTESGIYQDGTRTYFLEKYGLKVVRFSNHDIDRRFEEVCRAIDHEIQTRRSV